MISPLPMSVTKEELLRHLKIDGQTYNLMAKETDQIYKWLTSDHRNLKRNSKLNPPYDWNDITERAKYDALTMLGQSGDTRTCEIWNLATESATADCPNWIGRWFLYHKFRYRDGRSKSKEVGQGSSSKHQKKSRHHTRHDQMSSSSSDQGGYYDGSQGDDYESAIQGQEDSYYQYQPYSASATSYSPRYNTSDTSQPNGFYDPVKGWTSK